jgi:hypothetical protein
MLRTRKWYKTLLLAVLESAAPPLVSLQDAHALCARVLHVLFTSLQLLLRIA